MAPELSLERGQSALRVLGVTIDSNVYISALNFGGLCARLLSLGRYHLYRIDTTNDILDEVVGVLRDKFSWQPHRLHAARLTLSAHANLVAPLGRLRGIVADDDDHRILECAEAAQSDYIVTQDKDLLRIGSHRGIPIEPPSRFLERLRPS